MAGMKLHEQHRMGVDSTNQIIKGIELQKMAGFVNNDPIPAVTALCDRGMAKLQKVREPDGSFVDVPSPVDAEAKDSQDICVSGDGKTYRLDSGTSGELPYTAKQNICNLPVLDKKAQTTTVNERSVYDIENHERVTELKLSCMTAVSSFNKTECVLSRSATLSTMSALQKNKGSECAAAAPKSFPTSPWHQVQNITKAVNSCTYVSAVNPSSCQTTVKYPIPINAGLDHGLKNKQVKISSSNSTSSSYSLLEDLSKRWLAVHRRNQMVQDSLNTYKAMYNMVNNRNPAKRKYHTVSDSYIRYLNKPKWAKHEALEYIAMTASDQLETVEKTNPFLNSYVFPCDKHPLAGILRPKKRPILRSSKGLLQYRCIKKRKRSWKNPSIQDNAKLKYNQERSKDALLLANCTTGVSRLLSAKQLPSNNFNKPFVGAQYFSFPSEPSKSTGIASNAKKTYERIFSKNRLYKPALQVPQKKFVHGKHMMQNSYKNFQKSNRNVSALQRPSFKVVDLRHLFSCLHSPEPKQNLSFDEYEKLCILFHVRMLLCAGLVSLIHRNNSSNSERRSAVTEEPDLHTDTEKVMQSNSRKGKTIVHSAISVSIQAESSFTTWSKSLPFASLETIEKRKDSSEKNLESAEQVPKNAWYQPSSVPHTEVQVDVKCLVSIAQCFGIDKLPLSEQARISWYCDEFSEAVLLSLAKYSEADELRSLTIEPKKAWHDVNCDQMTVTHNTVSKRRLHSSPKLSNLNRINDCRKKALTGSLHNKNDLKIHGEKLNCKRKKIRTLPKAGFCVRFRIHSSKFNCFCNMTSFSPACDCRCWIDYCFSPIYHSHIDDCSFSQTVNNGHDLCEDITLNSENTYSTSLKIKSKTSTIIEQRHDSVLDNTADRSGVAIIGHSLATDHSNVDKENRAKQCPSSVMANLQKKNGLVKLDTSQKCSSFQYHSSDSEESVLHSQNETETRVLSSNKRVKSHEQYVLDQARAVWLEDISTAELEDDDGLVDLTAMIIDCESSQKTNNFRISNTESKPASHTPHTVKDNHLETKPTSSNFAKTNTKVIGSCKQTSGSPTGHGIISAVVDNAVGQSTSNSKIDTISLTPNTSEGIVLDDASKVLKINDKKTMGSLFCKPKKAIDLQQPSSVKTEDRLPCIKDEQMQSATKGMLAVKFELEENTKLSFCDKEKVANCAKSNIKLPAEIALPSHRSRSKRTATKRCRYEQDYVTELPKSGKRPKKTLVRRIYENHEFWDFYQRCQNSEYSKNLILLHKYIKLLKDNDIDAKLDTNHNFSWVPSLRLTNGRAEQKFNRDGLPPFMSRNVSYVKGSVLLLNPVSDHMCSYCGRCLKTESQSANNAHIKRHTMRSLPILSAPRHSKRKKKKGKAYRNTGKNLQNNTNGVQTTIVLVGAPENDNLPGNGNAVNSAANTSNAGDATSSACLDQIKQIKPFPKPSNISMGHKKQTARKSHSNLAINLPKERLIAVLKSQISSSSAEATASVSTKSPQPVQNISKNLTSKNSSSTGMLEAPSSSSQNLSGSLKSAVYVKKQPTPGTVRDSATASPAKLPVSPAKPQSSKTSCIKKSVIGLSKYAKGLVESTLNPSSNTHKKTTKNVVTNQGIPLSNLDQLRCPAKDSNTVHKSPNDSNAIAEKRTLQTGGSPYQSKKIKRQET